MFNPYFQYIRIHIIMVNSDTNVSIKHYSIEDNFYVPEEETIMGKSIDMLVKVDGKILVGSLYSCEKETTVLVVKDGLRPEEAPMFGDYVIDGVTQRVLVPNLRKVKFNTKELYDSNPEPCNGSIPFTFYVDECKPFSFKVEVPAVQNTKEEELVF